MAVSAQTRQRHPARRELLGAIASAAIAASAVSTAAPAAETFKRTPGVSVLVAYFSRTGNTRVVAHQIRRAHGADIFEIVPANAYPEDYEATVRQAERESTNSYEPPLRADVPKIRAYSTVFLGFPIWGETAPPIIRSFLSRHDLTGTTLVPFITHGGYGPGNSTQIIARHVPLTRMREALVMRADQERQTLAQVSRWLNDIKLAR